MLRLVDVRKQLCPLPAVFSRMRPNFYMHIEVIESSSYFQLSSSVYAISGSTRDFCGGKGGGQNIYF